MNQRASHFNMGNNPAGYSSIYTKDYTPKKADHQKNKTENPFRGTGIQENNQNLFVTTNKQMLKGLQNDKKSVLDPNKLRQLKAHHFQLGSHPQQSLTTHKQFHNRKDLSQDALKNQQQSKLKMRAHHHDFKEQKGTNFKSTYANQYVPKQKALRGPIKAQSGSSIMFGNHLIPMTTTNELNYTKKKPQYNRLQTTLQQNSALILGDKPQTMKTMNQLYYDAKNIVSNELPQATMKELRNTHFTLGQLKPDYNTQSCSYSKPEKTNLNFKIPKYQTGTWDDRSGKFNATTTNKRELPPRQTLPFQKAQPKNRGTFSLGGYGGQYQTQFNQNFTNKPHYPKDMAAGKEGSKDDNVVIGDNIGYYQTEHRSKFKERDPNDAKLKIDIAALNKEDHFSIGGQLNNEAYITVYQDQYRPDQDHKSALFHKQKLESKLQSSHQS